MHDQTSHGYWFKIIEENEVEHVEELLVGTNSAISNAQERALNIYYRKQQEYALSQKPKYWEKH